MFIFYYFIKRDTYKDICIYLTNNWNNLYDELKKNKDVTVFLSLHRKSQSIDDKINNNFDKALLLLMEDY